MDNELGSKLDLTPDSNKNSERAMFLGLDGIPMKTIPKDSTIFLSYSYSGYWSLSNQTNIHCLENQYLELNMKVSEKLWGSFQTFIDSENSINEHIKYMLLDTGLNPESPASKNDFAKILEKLTDIDDKRFFNKYLYTIDFFSLISNIQEVANEINYLTGEFYYILNFDSEFIGLPDESKVMVRTSKNPAANKLIGLMALIYIRLHSLLDYHTKLAYEIEKTKVNFDKYPRLSSKNKLYSDKKNLKIDSSKGTLFHKDPFIIEIESYRNELIHNSLLDDKPRIYERYRNNQVIERYILLPDIDENGRLESYVNRRFFYSNEKKFNHILPDLLQTFQERQLETLKVLSQMI